ncbi:MAG: MBL fold metallo-hydrolase [Gemmatimonadaceae bacterium]
MLRSPPVAPVRPVADDHFGTRIVDNYRYFENLKDPEVQEWMKAQADYARATLDALPGRVGAARSVAVKLPSADSTLVILLGTGNPVPDPEAAGPATAVVVGPRVFLFDAGAGVMRRVRAAKLPTSGPTALFITHLHSDHTLGYPDVIFTTWVMGRTKPLDVFGPHGLQSMTDHIIAAWKEDIDIRSHGLEHRASNGYAVRVHEIAPGVVYDSGGVKITAIPVLHGSWKEAYGYRIDTPDRSIVLSGDTRPSQAIEEAARGVDVLIHEAYPESANLTPRDSAFASYRRSFHTSAVELGRLAAIAKPKMVVLYHHVLPPDGGAALIAAVRGAGYQGRVIFGKDLDRF